MIRPLLRLGVSCGGNLLSLLCGNGAACCAADEFPSSVAAGVLLPLLAPLSA